MQGQKCTSSERYHKNLQENPHLIHEIEAIEEFTQKWSKKYDSNSTLREGITLPVVVHVVWLDPSENISDEQIQSQLTVLNEDFNKMNANWETTPDPFKSLVADIGIEFCLATVDPDGNPTNGITRTQTTIEMIGETPNFYSTTNGGQDPWDNTKYINVWIANQMDGSLGFATFPGTAEPPESDGIVIPGQFWGTIGTAAASAPNNLGKTATHEFGHYFNLFHLWADGGCDSDDMVEDTPLQSTESSGCPTFPFTEDCTPDGDGIMFMNYMDYADDACMSLFSEGQKVRMLAALNGPRVSLLESNGCGTMTATNDILNTEAITLFPNPVHGNNIYLNVNLEISKISNINFVLMDVRGMEVINKEINIKDESFIQIDGLEAGVYFSIITAKGKIFTNKIVKL